MKRYPALLVTSVLVAGLSWAGLTRTWIQTDFSEFEKGNLKGVSLRSDGRLTLAPEFKERFDSSSAYLWTLAQDSKGNLYAGGATGAKLYRISPNGDKKTLAEWEALEVHAIAVDKKDQIFAATSPDGKVYKVSPEGKSELFYDPKTKYIWAMAFNSKGDLFLATGDKGEIHRVPPDGKGSIFLATEETHARSLAIDAQDNLIVGTEPGGLVLRISPQGQSFVLHQTAKKEVTAVGIAKDGSIYAAGVGTKQPSSAPVPAPAPAPLQTAGAAAAPANPQRPAAPPPPTLAAGGPIAITGGTEVYRIYPDGRPRKVWTHAQDIVYAIGFDSQDRVLLGAGNKGSMYRIDSDSVYTALLNAPPTQVTCFLAGRDGKIYAATGNVGKVYQIGPGLEREGSIESDVLDASLFSHWGRLSFKGAGKGGKISLMTRSGNLERPQKNWSPWSEAITSEEGARVTSPASRFMQWKATLSASADGHSPEIESVEVAYLPQNVAPLIEEVEATPANYRFPPGATDTTTVSSTPPPSSLTLQPMGKRQRSGTPSAPIDLGTPTMQHAKGYIGARWSASDENGDPLTYTVQIRGARESEWKLLRNRVREKYLSWDSTAFPDGEYRLRVIASDAPGNPNESALSSQLDSPVFLIDNTPPRISSLSATRAGNGLTVRWKAIDSLNVIEKAEYSLNGGEWTAVLPQGGVSDSKELDYDLKLSNVSSGEQTIAVRAEDSYDNQATDKVVVR